jgi:two-component system OmpR family sensor kinase
VRERIFEAFVRGEGTSEKPGVGLGLSLVRRIAIAHGGTVEVGAATTRAGARFVLTLP